jgi:SAM-dependent methyltransferase
MDNLQQLKSILLQVGPENVWRPVYAPGNKKLADGIGDQDDGLPPDLSRIDFRGKTVADLGCNFGYYTFMAKQAGAKHVTGIDKDKRIIQGCRILKEMMGIEDVSFLATDIVQSDGLGTFDTGMMIDFIGKRSVRTGVFKDYLNVLERLSRKEMILSIRPAYHVKKHLSCELKALSQKYPGDCIRNDHFYLLEYVLTCFGRNWQMEIISPASTPPGTKKETLYFKRRN